MTRKKLRGIAMVNMILTIVGIIVLSSVAIFKVSGFINNAKEARAVSETSSMGSLISQFHQEVGRYPKNLSELTKKQNQYGPWINSLPKDPFSTSQQSYQYSYNSTSFIVYSVGVNHAGNSSLANGIQGDDIGFKGK